MHVVVCMVEAGLGWKEMDFRAKILKPFQGVFRLKSAKIIINILRTKERFSSNRSYFLAMKFTTSVSGNGCIQSPIRTYIRLSQ